MISVGTVLQKVGLYRPLARLRRDWFDAGRRAKRAEVVADLNLTRRQAAGWAHEIRPAAKSKGSYGILSFTDLPLHAKFQCLAGKIMQLHGYSPLVLTYTGFRLGKQYFKALGIPDVLDWDDYTPEQGPESDLARQEVSRLTDSIHSISDALSVRFHEVNVGKHALSVTCRRRVEGRLDISDPEVMALYNKHLHRAIQGVLAAERFFDAHALRGLLVRDVGYIPNGSIFEVALRRGIDCTFYEQGQRRGTWILKRYNRANFGQHYFSLSNDTWEKVRTGPWTEEHEKRVEAEFAGRYRVDSTDDTRRLQTGKKLKSPDEVRQQLGLDSNKKTAVIFSHVSWDGAFFFGSCLFNDFEDWLYQTVKHVAERCPELNWIVKLHPFNVFKLQRESKKEESEMRLLRPLMPLPDHVRLMRSDTDINTQSLFPVVDYALTVNGTVGMEFPCYGVPAVLAGTGRYDGKGFTIEPSTQQDYFRVLENLHTVPRLSREAVNLARRHYLAVAHDRQFSLEDVAEVELKRMNEAQSDVHDNLHFMTKSRDGFAKAASVERLGKWLFDSTATDILEPIDFRAGPTSPDRF